MKQNPAKHEAQSNKAIFNIGPNIVTYFIPLNPHDVLKRHIASLKDDLNSLNLGVLINFFL